MTFAIIIMRNMQKILHCCLFFLPFLFLCLTAGPSMAEDVIPIPIPIPIGVVLDLNSSLGAMAETCIRMGLLDFYNHNASYRTILTLHIRDSRNDIVTAAIEAWDLIKDERVHAIIGPQNSGEARFVAELGSKAHIPIISFSATSPSLSPTQTHFFIRTTPSDLSQVKPISAIAQAYGWLQIIPIYENTEYGNGLIPHLIDAFGDINIQVPYKCVIDPRSEEAEISKVLNKLKGMQTKIFLVHMTADLGSKFFKLAYKEGMIREGYAWIVTQGLSTMIDPMAPKVMGYMQGAVGVRPMVQKTKGLADFKRRWKALAKANNKTNVLTLLGLRAYDTVQALAIAIEKACALNSTFKKPNIANKSRVETGPKLLLSTILNTKFRGLSGDFNLSEGQLESSVFEIFNVIGKKERIIGYWSTQRGLYRELGEIGQPIVKGKLMKQPIWPGDTTEKPTKLRIGVPVGVGFPEFVSVEMQSPNGKAKCSGFAIDVFLEVAKVLPFSHDHEFVPLMMKKNEANAGNYYELLCQIKEKKLDAIVGDITILANRRRCVDFTLPYIESRVSMLVSMGSESDSSGTSILLRPFHWMLWLSLGLIFMSAAVTILLLEMICHQNRNGANVKKTKELIFIILFTVCTRKSKHWKSNLSISLAMLCSFLFLMASQIYTANLTSMLTEEVKVEPSFKHVQDIKRNNYFVGYQRDSWVRGLLIDRLGFNESQLKPYDTPQDYDKALSLGSKKGGVAAIFDETPYLMLFFSKYASRQYALVGPTFQTAGFGFAFPRKSALASYFSVAILNVTQDMQKIEGIKNKYSISSTIPSDSQTVSMSQSRSLTVNDFGSFFPVVGCILCFLCIFVIIKYMASCLGWKFRSSRTPRPASPGTQGASLPPNEAHHILSPHHSDTSINYLYHSDYY